jgi:hypothetical protein
MSGFATVMLPCYMPRQSLGALRRGTVATLLSPSDKTFCGATYFQCIRQTMSAPDLHAGSGVQWTLHNFLYSALQVRMFKDVLCGCVTWYLGKNADWRHLMIFESRGLALFSKDLGNSMWGGGGGGGWIGIATKVRNLPFVYYGSSVAQL